MNLKPAIIPIPSNFDPRLVTELLYRCELEVQTEKAFDRMLVDELLYRYEVEAIVNDTKFDYNKTLDLIHKATNDSGIKLLCEEMKSES